MSTLKVLYCVVEIVSISTLKVVHCVVTLMIGVITVDLLTLTIQTLILLVIGLLLGFNPNAGGMLLLIPLLLMAGLTMASSSYALALILKDEGSLAATVNLFALPLLLLSGVMLPLTLAPDVLKNIAKANPFAYAVNAGRALVNGSFSDIAVLQAFCIFAITAGLALFWATRAIRKAAM